MAPGESAQFSATARFSDGSTRDVTNEVVWISSGEAVLSVAASGVGTAHTIGEAGVGYQLNHQPSGTRPVLVVTPGTFLLTGLVVDGDARVFDARVEVVSGTAAGLVALSDWNGQFQLLGVSEDSVIRVTKDGFQSATPNGRGATGTGSRRSLSVDLVRVRPRPDYSGTYVLELTATCQGTSTVPDRLRRRLYTATLTQYADATVELRLGGADFELKYFPHGIGEGNRIHGRMTDGQVRLVIDDVWDWGVNPNLIERIGNGEHLIIAGEIVLRPTASGLSGALDGYFRITRNPYAEFSVAEACTSNTHGFVLSQSSGAVKDPQP
jgi:hypothetical protein